MAGLRHIYESSVLRRPVATLVVVCAFTLALGWYAQYFSLDASADSLTLERDEGLEYYRYVRARYGADDFLLVTYTPRAGLFSEPVLGDLRLLGDELQAIAGVESVMSILNVPLVNSPPVDLRNIDAGIRYLADPDTDRAMARQELVNSPLYASLLISADGRTTAIRVDIERDAEYRAMREQRDALREKQYVDGLTGDEKNSLADVSERYDQRTRELLARQDAVISRSGTGRQAATKTGRRLTAACASWGMPTARTSSTGRTTRSS